jgi:hypothetical protein
MAQHANQKPIDIQRSLLQFCGRLFCLEGHLEGGANILVATNLVIHKDIACLYPTKNKDKHIIN